MYSSLYFVIPVSLVLMCDICVPRRALPQIAAESKASALLPPAFKHFVCQSLLRAKRAAARGESAALRGRIAASRMSKNMNAHIVAMR
jgi:hypothetical protein